MAPIGQPACQSNESRRPARAAGLFVRAGTRHFLPGLDVFRFALRPEVGDVLRRAPAPRARGRLLPLPPRGGALWSCWQSAAASGGRESRRRCGESQPCSDAQAAEGCFLLQPPSLGAAPAKWQRWGLCCRS